MKDYSLFFKDESSPHVWIPLDKLRADYVCVEVVNYPTAGQCRSAFWVGGDGTNTMLYFTSGMGEVLANTAFEVRRVVGAVNTRIMDGRVKYMLEEDGAWLDLGPITAAGRLPEDMPIDSIRRIHGRAATTEKEAEKLVKEAVKHDFWSKGGSF